jgi:hypothetical protein
MVDKRLLQGYDPFQGSEVGSFETPAPISSSSVDDLDIRRFEEHLNVWESQLITQEQQLEQVQRTGIIEPPPNWPSFYPFVNFDPLAVPEPLRNFAKRAMFSWTLMAVTFALNFLGCVSLLRAGDSSDSPGSKIALSALYLFLIVPIALDLTALAVYRALQNPNPSSLTFVKVFLFLGTSTLFQAVLTLGFESSGSCGLVTMLNLFFGSHMMIGMLALVVTLGLALSTYFHFALLNGLWGYWRGTDQGWGDLEVGAKQLVANTIITALSQQHESGRLSPH